MNSSGKVLNELSNWINIRNQILNSILNWIIFRLDWIINIYRTPLPSTNICPLFVSFHSWFPSGNRHFWVNISEFFGFWVFFSSQKNLNVCLFSEFSLKKGGNRVSRFLLFFQLCQLKQNGFIFVLWSCCERKM